MQKPKNETQNRRLLIAIDGTAASGKGSLARRIADFYDLSYLDTGKIYRAVGLKILKNGIDVEKSPAQAIEMAKKIKVADLKSPALDTEEVGRIASIASAIPEIRAELLDFQRKYAKSSKGAVLDGRDIGTVVCPEAEFKLFITASLPTRAKRRFNELQSKGKDVIYEQVFNDLKERDERDSKRKISPLVPAKGAIKIDTSHMNLEEVFRKVISIIGMPN